MRYVMIIASSMLMLLSLTFFGACIGGRIGMIMGQVLTLAIVLAMFVFLGWVGKD